MFVAWYSLRGKKFIVFDIARVKAQHVRYGALPRCEIKTEREDIRKAYKIVFPKRYINYADIKIRRMLKREGFSAVPEELLIVRAQIDKKN